MSTTPTVNITLTPAEAAQVAEKVISIAQEEFGYGTQAREIIERAISEIRQSSGGTATMEPGATSLTSSTAALLAEGDALIADLSGEAPTLESRVAALEALAKRHLGVDPY